MNKMIVYYAKYELLDDERKHEKEHKIGLNLLKYALNKEKNIKLSESEMREQYTLGNFGKPYLLDYRDIFFNISHCDGWVSILLFDHPVGIDIERIGYVSNAMVKKVLTENEMLYLDRFKEDEKKYKFEFYRFWTLKESYLKCIGKGFYEDPKSVEFTIDSTISCSDSNVSCIQRILDDDCILSICFEGKESVINYESYKEEMVGTDC